MKERDWKSVFADLRKKIFAPTYLLMGEEPFFIDVIAEQIEKRVLDEAEKEFNQTILYGRDTDVPTLVSIAKRYPMMANHHVVIVKEAHMLKNIEELEPYIRKPVSSTVLVLCHKYKSIPKNRTFVKAFYDNKGVVMESNKMYDNQIPGWIAETVKNHGYRIDNKATQLLADHLGNDLGKIINELKKVYISLQKGGEITPQLIEKNIGISKDFNVFELQNALTQKDSFKAFQIVKYFADNPKSNPIMMTMAVLYTYFSRILVYHRLKDKSEKSVVSELKMRPFFVKDLQRAAARYSEPKVFSIMSLLREYDVRSKGVDNQSASHGELFKEMIYKILN